MTTWSVYLYNSGVCNRYQVIINANKTNRLKNRGIYCFSTTSATVSAGDVIVSLLICHAVSLICMFDMQIWNNYCLSTKDATVIVSVLISICEINCYY